MKLKEISESNRPRERLVRQGAKSLSDAEVLSVILQNGTREENAIDVAQRLVSEHGLKKLSECSFEEIKKTKGIGTAKACQVLAAYELGIRSQVEKENPLNFTRASDVFKYLSPRMSCLGKEHFVVLHLNAKNRLVGEETVSIGTLDSSLIHPREVFKSAIQKSAHSVIIAHNHPSGDPLPSEEDIRITAILKDAGSLLGIPVLDHVIIGRKKHYSFSER